jgi:hypothetical protein
MDRNPDPVQYNESLFLRSLDSSEVTREMDSMAEMGQEFYQESGNLLKLAGVLRAADVFWNPNKRQVFRSCFIMSSVLKQGPSEIYS